MAGDKKAVRRSDGDVAATTKRARTEAAPPAAASPDAALVNEYAGFVVPAADFALERVHIDDVTPESFFAKYVATRTPVVLTGFIRDEAFQAPAKWTNAYLAETAGDERLSVERRSSTTDKFGKGIHVPMTFRELLALIAQGDAMHYLTTQEVAVNDDEGGRPELMASFVAKLQRDGFPLRPALLGNLVPQNINIWMGNNTAGSSSGLHHDYHDNLYLLLRGKKRFRLYSPADAAKMYTRGRLVRVHANGRINYAGEETTAYGADPSFEQDALAHFEKVDAEKELELAERAVENGEDGAEARLEAAEERLDRAMMRVLRAERDDEPEGDDSSDENGAFHFDDDDDEEEEEEEAVAQEDAAPAAATNAENKPQEVKYPVSFSRVDTALLQDPTTKAQLEAEFPEFTTANAAFCELQEGEMLFLPASWFHEVESYGSANGHLALNYWFHPPDQFDSFDTPYSSPLWPRDWDLRFDENGKREAVALEEDDEGEGSDEEDEQSS
uniref:JmjC domain-containing protein n=1 Tax=Globisporangium ultimum (strain ATCC 200006 / CBS 805.95 / DAOM BR144) TaxID=431595 RepID=K3WEL6_GLOUD